MLGDNIVCESIRPAVEAYMQQERGAKIFLKPVENPSSFGVATVVDGRIVSIMEKPEHPESNLAVVGIYLYDARVFEIVQTLKPSARGELEISDVNQAYLDEGGLTYEMLNGFWGDGGESFDSLLAAAIYIAQEHRQSICCPATAATGNGAAHPPVLSPAD